MFIFILKNINIIILISNLILISKDNIIDKVDKYKNKKKKNSNKVEFFSFNNKWIFTKLR